MSFTPLLDSFDTELEFILIDIVNHLIYFRCEIEVLHQFYQDLDLDLMSPDHG